MTDNSKRTEQIAGLRALADFLEEHPDLPSPFAVEARVHLEGADAEKVAEVDRIASILSATPTLSMRRHYRTQREFGGGVCYGAVAIPADVMAQWDATISYASVIQP